MRVVVLDHEGGGIKPRFVHVGFRHMVLGMFAPLPIERCSSRLSGRHSPPSPSPSPITPSPCPRHPSTSSSSLSYTSDDDSVFLSPGKTPPCRHAPAPRGAPRLSLCLSLLLLAPLLCLTAALALGWSAATIAAATTCILLTSLVVAAAVVTAVRRREYTSLPSSPYSPLPGPHSPLPPDPLPSLRSLRPPGHLA